MSELSKAVADFEKALKAVSKAKSELLRVLRALYADNMYEHGVGTRLAKLHEYSNVAISYLSQVLSGRREPKEAILLRIGGAYLKFEKSRKKILQPEK